MTETADQRAAAGDAAPAGAGLDLASAPSASALNASPSGARSFGAALSSERERQGLSINDIAARLRLHPKQIAAIEQEQFQQLPAPAFVRGFVRNYAKELRLAPEALLAQVNSRLPLDGGAALAPGGSAAVRAASAERLSRGLTIFGIVGGLVVLGVVGWIAKPPRTPTVTAPAKGDVVPIAIPAPPAPPAETAPLASTPQQSTIAGSNNAIAAAVPAPSPKTAIAPAPVASAPANTVAGAPSSNSRTEVPVPAANAAPNQAAAIGTVRLVFGDKPSWLEVTQGDGRLLFSGINDAGSQRMLVGVPPLRLVIGNASAVLLDYRGRRIDLKPVTSIDDVARVTLEAGTP